jgi:hypothetical protein
MRAAASCACLDDRCCCLSALRYRAMPGVPSAGTALSRSWRPAPGSPGGRQPAAAFLYDPSVAQHRSGYASSAEQLGTIVTDTALDSDLCRNGCMNGQ